MGARRLIPGRLLKARLASRGGSLGQPRDRVLRRIARRITGHTNEALGAVKNVLFGAVLFPPDEEALTKQPGGAW